MKLGMKAAVKLKSNVIADTKKKISRLIIRGTVEVKYTEEGRDMMLYFI